MVVAMLLALFPTLYGGALFPLLRLYFAAPLVVWLYYRLNQMGALWVSLAVGALLDLLSSGHGFGTYALVYCVTTLFVYRAKPRFYQWGWTTLPILTWLFSIVATLLQAVLFTLAGSGGLLTPMWAATDLLLFPLADAVWAFVAFTLPLRLLQLRRRVDRPVRLARPQ